jgi:hypothetical protein
MPCDDCGKVAALLLMRDQALRTIVKIAALHKEKQIENTALFALGEKLGTRSSDTGFAGLPEEQQAKGGGNA